MKKYATYKDSGIEWIGEIPEHWEVTKLKYIGDAFGGLTYSPNDVVADETQGKLVLRSSNIQNGKLSLKDNVYVNLPISDKLTLRKGDILICSRNGSQHLIGKNICIGDQMEGNTFGAFMMIFRSKQYSFLNHFFNSPIFTSQSGLFLTATINQLTSGTINNFWIAIPKSMDEQLMIADYLDQKTSEIEKLVNRKKQLIALLKEERTGIINNAVTKGINPNVKLKDTGVEWIGEIPEHWDYSKLKYYSTSKTGSTPSRDKNEYWENGTIPWMSSGEINQKFIYNIKENISELGFKNSSVTLLPINTVMMAMNGQGKTKGTVGVLKTASTCNQSLTGFICNENKLHYLYLFYFLDSKYKDLRGLVGEDREGLSSVLLKNIFIPLPGIQEQIDIADYLTTKSSEINSAITKTEKEIELMKEYKTALISEVVTGKIDVREEVLS